MLHVINSYNSIVIYLLLVFIIFVREFDTTRIVSSYNFAVQQLSPRNLVFEGRTMRHHTQDNTHRTRSHTQDKHQHTGTDTFARAAIAAQETAQPQEDLESMRTLQ